MANANEIISVISDANLIADNFHTIENSFMDVAKDMKSVRDVTNSLSKKVRSHGARIFVLQCVALGGIYIVSKMQEKMDKMNARLLALESEKEFDEMEKVIKK